MGSSGTSKPLDAIPSVGPALATALVASIADAKAFRSERDFSAWVGLVPKQNSSGCKDKLGCISKQGDRYLRSLFTAGALDWNAELAKFVVRNYHPTGEACPDHIKVADASRRP